MWLELVAFVSILIVGAEIVIAALFVSRRKFRGLLGASPKLLKPNYQRDVVYLAQFPCVPYVRSISPFCLKVETWLRMNKIKYESIYTLKFGPKGQLPYVEFNGEQIADSSILIDRLADHFKVDSYPKVSVEQKGVARALEMMVENQTALAGFHWRYGYNMNEFVETLCRESFPTKSLKFWSFIQPTVTKVKGALHGIGKHTNEEIAEFSFKDIQALADVLGTNSFMLGEQPTLVDCVIFGNLAQFVYIPMPFPQKEFIQSNCPTLSAYVNRVKDAYFPDWNHLCSVEAMEGFQAPDYAKAMAKP